jgi:beta-lactamase class D
MRRKAARHLILLAGVLASACAGLPGVAPNPGSHVETPASLTDVSMADAEGCDALAERAPQSTFVLFAAATGTWVGCRPDRARARFLPASTFKVPHALIALETGVVKDAFATMPWDGRERRVPAWNQDTSLASGLRNSTVWVYQRTARRVGWNRMRTWVARLGYGNADIGPLEDLSSFWLRGNLSISAIEQVRFLDALRAGRLPARPGNQARVRELMEIERSANGGAPAPEWILYAKSGAVLPISADTGDIVDEGVGAAGLEGKERVGWFVGWVAQPPERGGDGVFALNLRLTGPDDLSKREPLARQLLSRNGMLPKVSPR